MKHVVGNALLALRNMTLPQNVIRLEPDQWLFASNASTAQDQTPQFVVYDDAFLDIVGPAPSLTLAIQEDFAFAHEAGVYVPSQDAVYITSDRLGSGPNTTTKIGVVTRDNGTYSYESLNTDIITPNGGINYGNDSILFCNQGNMTDSGGIVVMKNTAPYETQLLVSSFYGRQFSSLNDVVVDSDGSIWFTDPIYGYEQGFRPKPSLPNEVYRFDPTTGNVRVAADGFGRPNGLSFSPDEQVMYITDTDYVHGDGTKDPTRASTIYAFDVIKRNGSSFLANRRVFAFADVPIPDGIKTDLQGNVYSGCGDGVNVWSPGGVLLGKIIIPGGTSNFCFGKKGEIFILNQTKFWVAKVADDVQGALLQSMGIPV